MTHKQRMLMAARGEMPDMLPYAPRIDLWHNANSRAGTLPRKHKGRTADEIARAEGWALHHVVPDHYNSQRPDVILHRGLGLHSLKEYVFKFAFSPNIDIQITRDGERTRVEYHTPVGTVSTTTIYTKKMKESGISVPWIEEHVIKKSDDCKVTGYIFENLDIVPFFDEFIEWQREIGEDGVAVTGFTNAASPMHHIQKYFLGGTEFYYYYNDYQKQMRALADSMEPLYEKALKIIAVSPAEMVLWGANYDDMITYPRYFEKELLPWIRKSSDILGEKGKLAISHCDGENRGLLDLIRDSNVHVAEAICPYPMTKVKIEEYYHHWADKITIFGGIPSNILLAESATDEDFEAYLDHLFKVIAPGKRFILGIADTTPPKAIFERLIRISQWVEKQGKLPFEGGSARPLSEGLLSSVEVRLKPKPVANESLGMVQDDVIRGRDDLITDHVLDMLGRGMSAEDILKKALIPAMEIIGNEFKAGNVYIPEVLLAARALNKAVSFMEPHFYGATREANKKVLIGTVNGDMHDIGKNMVATMLRGTGFSVMDLGVNVPTEKFVEEVETFNPDIVAISALLTTTMPEMKRVIESLDKAGFRKSVKIIVGGAPVSEKFARDIGADGYGEDAVEAVSLAKNLLNSM